MSAAGRACWPAAAPASRKTSSEGRRPVRTFSASVAAKGVSATPVMPIPAHAMRPSWPSRTNAATPHVA